MATLRNQAFVFDKDDLTPKCGTVLEILQDLVKHFQYLMEDKPSPLKKGISRPCHIAIKKVEVSLEMIQKIGNEEVIPSADRKNLVSLKAEIVKTLEQLKEEGNQFVKSANEFAVEPLILERRATMISASRLLVRQVTKLLILADYVDVANLLEMVKTTETVFNDVRHAETSAEFEQSVKALGAKAGELYVQSGLRQVDLLPEHESIRTELAAARQELKDSGLRLIATSKAYFVNPNMDAAAQNRTEAIRNFQETLKRIGMAIKGGPPKEQEDHGIQFAELKIAPNIGDDLQHFEDFLPEPIEFETSYHSKDLQSRLESIIEGAAAIADMPSTNMNRKDKIIGCCEDVRSALSDLLNDYMTGSAGDKIDLQAAIDNMINKNRELHGHLRRAAGDQVGDAFLDPLVPFLCIYEAARTGEVQKVKEYSAVFSIHADKMVESAKVSAYMSDNKILKQNLLVTADDLSQTIHPVVNAALTLSGNNEEQCYIENMDVIKAEWESKLMKLLESVNKSVDVVDFLDRSQEEILREIAKCIQASQDREAKKLDESAAIVSGRIQRIHDVVITDMECYEPDFYVDRAKALTKELKEIHLKQFANVATDTVENIENGNEIDTDEFVASTNLVFTAVTDVFRAVLETRSPEEYAYLTMTHPDGGDREDAVSGVLSGITGITVDTVNSVEVAERNELLQSMDPTQKEEIDANINDFQELKKKAESEFEKYEQNDLLAIAQKMTKIMTQMTQYQRGEGPLKTNKDVIKAATKLSMYGNQLREAAEPIVSECTDKILSDQLQDNLAKIEPLQHQLKVLARVKQEVEQVAGDLVVSGLESVTSLIQNAKNLLLAVLETVRSAHTCSIRMEASPMVWNPKMPSKKPLIIDTSDKKNRRRIVRRETNKFQKAEISLMNFIND